VPRTVPGDRDLEDDQDVEPEEIDETTPVSTDKPQGSQAENRPATPSKQGKSPVTPSTPSQRSWPCTFLSSGRGSFHNCTRGEDRSDTHRQV